MRRTPSPPPQLPGYRYVSLLGAGGFSDVFLYEQELPRRRVAVKVLLAEEMTAASRAAFVAEANLMAQLSNHPYIVTIYHAAVAGDGRPYFAMEYCSGPSLADRYKQAPLSVVEALRTGVRLSSAIVVAHQAGILHRDIKPANVLSNDYGWPALTDFGISSTVDDELTASTTTLAEALDGATDGGTGNVGLSVPWSPPEMFEDYPRPDVRSDVFSLAATLWTVLAGQTPFEVRGRPNGTLDLIGRIERGAITPMARDDVPRSLLAVLQKGMSTDPDRRFATAADFARALQRVELELGYARTELEVPNLVIAAPAPDHSDVTGDETRVRSVATIDAQAGPAAAVPPAEPDVSGGADETHVRAVPRVTAQSADAPPLDETVVRRVTPVADASTAASETADTADEVPSRPRTALMVALGVVGALVIGGVIAGIVLGDGLTPEGSTSASPTPGATGQAAVVPEAVDAPRLVGEPSFDAVGMTFVVDNTDPVEGDQLVWRISNRSSAEPLRTLDGDTVVVEGVGPADGVCVEVSVRRAGQLSAPLEVCAA